LRRVGKGERAWFTVSIWSPVDGLLRRPGLPCRRYGLPHKLRGGSCRLRKVPTLEEQCRCQSASRQVIFSIRLILLCLDKSNETFRSCGKMREGFVSVKIFQQPVFFTASRSGWCLKSALMSKSDHLLFHASACGAEARRQVALITLRKSNCCQKPASPSVVQDDPEVSRSMLFFGCDSGLRIYRCDGSAVSH
jgi:hypothetical protein